MEEVYCNGPRVHEFLQEMNREVLSHYDIATIGEGVGIPPEKANLYVGADRGELNMIFHFGHMLIDNGPGGKFDIVAIDPQEFKDIFIRWDRAIGDSGWLNIYLDNHDFPRLVSRFGDDSHPTSHSASAKLLAMLLLTLRGTPCLYQGTEIGMTNVAFPRLDDYRDVEVKNLVERWRREGRDLKELLPAIHHQARDNSRTPMQWTRGPNAGFTTGTPWIGVNPNYLTRDINATAAQAHESSIFHFYRKLLTLRRQHPTLIHGDLHPIDNPSMPPTLFAYLRTPPHPQSRDGRLHQPAPSSNSYLIVLNRSPNPTPPLDTLCSQDLFEDLNANDLRLLLSNAPQPSSPCAPLAPWECRLFLLELR